MHISPALLDAKTLREKMARYERQVSFAASTTSVVNMQVQFGDVMPKRAKHQIAPLKAKENSKITNTVVSSVPSAGVADL